MKEFASDMQSAHGFQLSQLTKTDFYFKRDLPETLRALEELSWNYFWSWNPEGVDLFRELDPALWDKCEQNPRLLLRNIGELRLWQKSLDVGYIKRLRQFSWKQNEYVSQKPDPYGKITAENPVAYFCAEYGVHNSLPTYSGGLGILAGDHLKSASDMNVPLVAIGLLYRFGYFRQRFSHDGWQEEEYQDVFNSDLALKPITDENGERLMIMVHIRGREVFAQVWLAQIGRISLHLLDTNVEQNAEIDRLITGHLYGGTSETRIVQEKILGIGGVRLLRKLKLAPSVFHLNEGHSAFLTLELAREYLDENSDKGFTDAVAAVREQCVFTTHTPVSAGNDAFTVEDLRECFDANFISSLKLSEHDFYAFGRVNPHDENEPFGMTPLAIRMCRSANGVSEKHGEVSRELWIKMLPEGSPASDVPITHITNGVHAPTWIAPAFQQLYNEKIGTDWPEILIDRAGWHKAIDSLSNEEIWNAHRSLKNLMIAFIREQSNVKDSGSRETINEHVETRKFFSPDVLTIGFARRVAAYKRWNLLLSDIERLLKMVDDPDRPVQFVFAGKAHPQDRGAKKILQDLMSINQESNWQNRAVFIEDYDQEVARYLVQGVDVWMNVPRRPLEASGTSGQKAAMNGALNFSVLDGWWLEGYNGINGFAIGELNDDEDDAVIDADDAEFLYSTLENKIIPSFYNRGESGLPDEWIGRMKDALATLTPQFSSDRMLRDYIEKIYRK
ncbi:MAG: alpha-glucan family phosphorylase [Pyrinomonadaceae bacterium]